VASPSSRRRLGLAGAVLAAAVVLPGTWVLVGGASRDPALPDALAGNRFAQRGGYADPGSRTAQAARQAAADGEPARAEAFERLAKVPTGIWLTPEEHPTGDVGPYVTSMLAAADDAGEVATLVVYGIPDRDCSGGYSDGGLTAGEYEPWVREIAAAAGTHDGAVVVLEPDALAAAVQCDQREQRVALLAAAVDELRRAGVTTYVDGGHSSWVPPATMARLLRRVGVERVRGFATNVANYQAELDERAYAARLSDLLGGTHYVIDTGRDGNGSTREWCNPPGRALGTEPGFVDDGTGLDALLWVKPPGESDGECGGGPPAGEFWPERAWQLTRESGW
jgi:endoglucanase